MSNTRARRYDRGMRRPERWRLGQIRQALLQDVTGRVLEIGAGTGVNLPWYPAGTHVVTLDRDPLMLAGIGSKHPRQPRLCADAQRLPFADNQFDFVVGTLVFCSIPQPALALAEIQRVLRPAGQLRLLEHVRGQRIPTRQLTDWLSPLWLRLTQDCHLNRETAQAVARAGFRIDYSDIHLWGLFQQIRATSPKR